MTQPKLLEQARAKYTELLKRAADIKYIFYHINGEDCGYCATLAGACWNCDLTDGSTVENTYYGCKGTPWHLMRKLIRAPLPATMLVAPMRVAIQWELMYFDAVEAGEAEKREFVEWFTNYFVTDCGWQRWLMEVGNTNGNVDYSNAA